MMHKNILVDSSSHEKQNFAACTKVKLSASRKAEETQAFRGEPEPNVSRPTIGRRLPKGGNLGFPLAQAEKTSRKKGESLLISHAAFLAIGVTALIIISSMVWNVYDSIIKEEARKDLSRISEAVASEIIKLYALKDSTAKPDTNKSILLGESSINLQQKAGGRQYSIELMGAGQITLTNISEGNVTRYGSQIIASVSNPQTQINYTLYNIDSRMQGYGFGDKPIVLKYYRMNYNGTVEDRIVLNNGLIISGESIG